MSFGRWRIYRTIPAEYSPSTYQQTGDAHLKRLIVLIALGPAASFAQSTYSIRGTIVGYYMAQNENVCSLAIKSDSNRYYSHGYHVVYNKNICSFAKTLYALGGKVAVTARLRQGGNLIETLEAIRDDKVYWPSNGYGKYRG